MIYVGCVMRIRTMAALLEYVPRLSQNALRIHGMDTLPFNLYLYKYENVCVYVCVCVFVCLFVSVFLGHFETNWDSLWHKVAIYPRKCSNTKIYLIGAFII